jgi:hypothetical protein
MNIQPKHHPLEKPIYNEPTFMNKVLLKPLNYTSEPVSTIITRNVDVDEPKKSDIFSSVIDDFQSHTSNLSEDQTTYFNRLLLSKSNFAGSNGGDLDSILSNMKSDIKEIEQKIYKIRKQQFAYKTKVTIENKNDFEDFLLDLSLIDKVQNILSHFEEIKL